MIDHPIYFDNHATTPLDPRVLEAMLPYFTEIFGNPGSATHDFGRAAGRPSTRRGRRSPRPSAPRSKEIVFTSGATESNNLALRGAAESSRRRENTSSASPPSTLPCSIRSIGLDVTGWK